MWRLRREINTYLQRYAWRGSRVDEATFLVQNYCYADLPKRTTSPTKWIQDLIFVPSVERIALVTSGGQVLEFTEDLVLLRHHKIELHMYRFGLDDPRIRRLLYQQDAIPPDARCPAVDGSNGDWYFLTDWFRRLHRQDRDKAVTAISTEIGHMLPALFADHGFVLCQSELVVYIYDRQLKLKHQFRTGATVVGFDAIQKDIFCRYGTRVDRYSFDGQFRNALHAVIKTFAIGRASHDAFLVIDCSPSGTFTHTNSTFAHHMATARRADVTLGDANFF